MDILLASTPDHNVVFACIEKKVHHRGHRYYKMNTSILTDETYIQEIKKMFTKVLIDYESIIDKRTLWDPFKIKAKEFSIRFLQIMQRKRESS